MATKKKTKTPAKDAAAAAVAKYGALAADLPATVLAQLNLSSNDDLASQVLGIFEKEAKTQEGAAQELNIDEVIILLYKEHELVAERDSVSRLLGTLARKGKLTKVEKRKGRYKLAA